MPSSTRRRRARDTFGPLMWAAVRAGWLYATPPVKAAACCQGVCVFRYADDMPGLAAAQRVRVLIVEDELYMAEAIRDGRTARTGICIRGCVGRQRAPRLLRRQ